MKIRWLPTICAVCGKTVAVKDDGNIYKHRPPGNLGAHCENSGASSLTNDVIMWERGKGSAG